MNRFQLTLFEWRMVSIPACFFVLFVFLGSLINLAQAGTGDMQAGQNPVPVQELYQLENKEWAISVRPSNLEMVAKPAGKAEFLFSCAQPGLGSVRNIKTERDRIQWETGEGSICFSLHLTGSDFSVAIAVSNRDEFTWPIIQEADTLKALIWPRWEGCYIPINDGRWRNYLIDYGDWSTTDGLCMPFWGLDCESYTLTYIAENPFNNHIRFSQPNDKLAFQLTHEFPSINPSRNMNFVVHLGSRESPAEPAKAYRRWLMENQRFVSMKEKIQRIPKAEQLLGAAHVYLWGDAPFSRYDVKTKKWNSLCLRMIEQNRDGKHSPGKRLKEIMNPERWRTVVELSKTEHASIYQQSQLAEELSRLLDIPDFYNSADWEGIALPEEALDLLKQNPQSLSDADRCRLNSLVLKAAYPDLLLEIDEWGNGLSLKMLNRFQAEGFDRMRFCLDSWLGALKRPQLARVADERGCLLGAYDSYDSVHDPSAKGSDNSWETAQFDRELYENGPIVLKNGLKKPGFKKIGYMLSPIAARPYVERRVNSYLRIIPFNYFFMDCDAFGEDFDDYSPLHPTPMQNAADARVDRLKWIQDQYRTVMGSEGGSAYFVPALHVVEGVVTPVIGWGDSARKDKNSKYYLGRYWPPDGPEVFMKTVPLQEEYRYFYFDPRFRLPLYETVFHDSIVTTHHWSSGSLKYEDTIKLNAMIEMLYMVPPLYHINLDEFEQRKAWMKKHYSFFSPLHRELGFAELTDFQWLTADRLVQLAVFDNRVNLIANFSNDVFTYRGVQIPQNSVMAQWKDTGRRQFFTP